VASLSRIAKLDRHLCVAQVGLPRFPVECSFFHDHLDDKQEGDNLLMTAELLMALTMLCTPAADGANTPSRESCQLELIKCVQTSKKQNGDTLVACYIKHTENE
jgi:hypothetical protein